MYVEITVRMTNVNTMPTPKRTQTTILVLMYTAAIFAMYMMRANMSFAMNGPVGMGEQ